MKITGDAIDILLNNERSEYLIALDEAKIRLTEDLRRVPIFRDLLTKVTPFALRKMLPEYTLVQTHQMKPYTKVFGATMGLPYAHKMEERMPGPGGVLKLEDIHSHWHLKTANAMDSDDLLRINEPATVIPRGRPPGSRNKRRRQPDNEETTRRDPSGFEYSRALFERAVANAQRFTRRSTG